MAPRTPILLASTLLVLAIAPAPASSHTVDGPACAFTGQASPLSPTVGAVTLDCGGPVSCPANAAGGCAVRYHLELSFDGASLDPCLQGLSGSACWSCTAATASCGPCASAALPCGWQCSGSASLACVGDFDWGDHLAAGESHPAIGCGIAAAVATSFSLSCGTVLEYAHGNGNGHALR